ncbi:MAG TPA: hypothetical protein VGX50_19760, partial [Longimicrobium sp.]|nr:hypothetical protein [Longimicrobium sp.]
NALGDTLRVCAFFDGQLREIAAEVDPATGDTMVNGHPLGDIHPPSTAPYLAREEWYRTDGMVVFQDRRYVRYGIPRVIRAHALTRVGEFRGIPLFAENRRAAAGFVYALVSPACDFQPYWYAATVGKVLGR